VRGERAAWQTLLERHEVTIHYAVLNTMRARGHAPASDEITDLECDIVLALADRGFRKLAAYSGRCKLSHWIKVVASHYTIDRLRQRRSTLSLDDPKVEALRATLHTAAPSPRDLCQRREQLAALRTLYRDLPEADQEFVELYVFRELPFETIARQMNTSVGAVYARKNRVRKKLLALAHSQGISA
jgi:RNA polymerase sigma factor (sigma-70 family)